MDSGAVGTTLSNLRSSSAVPSAGVADPDDQSHTVLRGVSGSEVGPSTADLLRLCLLVVAALAVAGTAVELAMIRHWKSPVQVVPWVGLGMMAIAISLVWARPTCRTVLVARGLAIVVAFSAAIGMFAHVLGNHEAGPLDFRYMDTWATMSAGARWWAAATKTVGPAPPVAPGVLAQAALCLLFATVRHPVLAHGREDGA